MEYILPEYEDWLGDASRELERECERMSEKMERMNEYRKFFEIAGDLLTDNKKMKAENDDLRRQLQEMEMRLNEMSKLSAGVVKKSSQDEVLKAVRTFVNKSKQKTSKKRTLIKEMVLEFTFANGIALPDELAQAVYALDDEPEVLTEVHNHFEAGSNSQVFNEKVVGTFSGV